MDRWTMQVDAIIDIAYYVATELVKKGGASMHTMEELKDLRFKDECDGGVLPRDVSYDRLRGFISCIDFESPHSLSRLLIWCATEVKDMPMEQCWLAVHDANMEKYTNPVYGDDGKLLKPKNFVPPDERIQHIIENQ